jgi:hypothetical protein
MPFVQERQFALRALCKHLASVGLLALVPTPVFWPPLGFGTIERVQITSWVYHDRQRYDALRALVDVVSDERNGIIDDYTLFARRLEVAVERLREIVAPTAPCAERLRFDDQTHTAHLDGKAVQISDPKVYTVYKTIVKACPLPVTAQAIQLQVPGCRGDKKIRTLLRCLPETLRRTILSNTSGYWLQLPYPSHAP